MIDNIPNFPSQPDLDRNRPITITMSLQEWLETRAALQFYATNCADGRYGEMPPHRVAEWINVYQRFDRTFHMAKNDAPPLAIESKLGWFRRLLARICNGIDSMMEV